MIPHDYIDYGEGVCAECNKPPGHYIHIGISEEDAAEWPSREGAVGFRQVTDPPLVLLER